MRVMSCGLVPWPKVNRVKLGGGGGGSVGSPHLHSALHTHHTGLLYTVGWRDLALFSSGHIAV